MKILVISDSHGYSGNIIRVLQKVNDIDMLIHLGDGEKEFESIKMTYPKIKMYHVAGNCDYNSLSPNELIIPVDFNIKIFATHGHRYYVKYSLDAIKSSAIENGCSIALFGHTHQRLEKYEDGLYILNPGSISCPRDDNKPSYGIVEISKSGIITNICDAC
ncbi:MAG: metallophosphoesterase [Oscillospiraceae bacterium]